MHTIGMALQSVLTYPHLLDGLRRILTTAQSVTCRGHCLDGIEGRGRTVLFRCALP